MDAQPTLDNRILAIVDHLEGADLERFVGEVLEPCHGFQFHTIADQIAAGDDDATSKLLAMSGLIEAVVRAWEVSIVLVADPGWRRAVSGPIAIDPTDLARFDELTDELRRTVGVG